MPDRRIRWCRPRLALLRRVMTLAMEPRFVPLLRSNSGKHLAVAERQVVQASSIMHATFG
jgi:hypothetical protein